MTARLGRFSVSLDHRTKMVLVFAANYFTCRTDQIDHNLDQIDQINHDLDQIDQIDHDLDQTDQIDHDLHQIDQIDHDQDHLDPNLPF